MYVVVIYMYIYNIYIYIYINNEIIPGFRCISSLYCCSSVSCGRRMAAHFRQCWRVTVGFGCWRLCTDGCWVVVLCCSGVLKDVSVAMGAWAR